jgi:hypothetical protein
MMLQNQISLNPYSIARSLGFTTILLAFASITTQLIACTTNNKGFIFQLALLFNLDTEQNIPTFFSTGLLIFSTIILFLIASIEKRQVTYQAPYWRILWLGFSLMSIDEFASLHELLVSPASKFLKFLGNKNLGIFYFAWIIPAIILVVFLTVFFRDFLFSLPPKTKNTFLLSAIIYLSGCIGVEMIEGWYSEKYGIELFKKYGSKLYDIPYSLMTIVEESMEMVGIIIFIWGLITYMNHNHKIIQIKFN